MANNKRGTKYDLDNLHHHLPKLQKLNNWTGDVLSEHMIRFDRQTDGGYEKTVVSPLTKEEFSHVLSDSVSLVKNWPSKERPCSIPSQKNLAVKETNEFTNVDNIQTICNRGEELAIPLETQCGEIHSSQFTDVERLEIKVDAKRNSSSFFPEAKLEGNVPTILTIVENLETENDGKENFLLDISKKVNGKSCSSANKTSDLEGLDITVNAKENSVPLPDTRQKENATTITDDEEFKLILDKETNTPTSIRKNLRVDELSVWSDDVKYLQNANEKQALFPVFTDDISQIETHQAWLSVETEKTNSKQNETNRFKSLAQVS